MGREGVGTRIRGTPGCCGSQGWWKVRLDGAKARTGKGVGVESGSGLGEGCQRCGSPGIMGNVGLERMGAYLDGDQNVAEGLCFPH